MSNKPTTIRPSPVLRAYLGSRQYGATASLNNLYDRYQILRNALALNLTDEEKQVVKQMLQGVALNDSQFVIACLALQQDIYDDEFIALPGSKTLAEKLSAANTAELVATVDGLGY